MAVAIHVCDRESVTPLPTSWQTGVKRLPDVVPANLQLKWNDNFAFACLYCRYGDWNVLPDIEKAVVLVIKLIGCVRVVAKRPGFLTSFSSVY